MKLYKKDIANLPESECIGWQYSHLEKKNSFGNSFDAIITQNLKDNWLTIHLLRYGISRDPQTVKLESCWFIPDVDHIDDYFRPLGYLEKKIKKKLKKDLMEKYVHFCDLSDAANDIKAKIEKQKKLKKENESI